MNKSIYLVEDNQDIAYIIQFLLNEEEMDVTIFSTIKSFRNSINELLPDLFIFDVNLPDGNGITIM